MDDRAGVAHALQYLGLIAMGSGDLAAAKRLIADSRRIAADAKADWELAWAHLFAGVLAFEVDRFEKAAHHLAQSALVNGADGDPELEAWLNVGRGLVAWHEGEGAHGAQPLADAIRAFDRLGGVWGLSLGLMVAGLTLGTAGLTDDAVSVLAASETVRDAAGIAMLPFAGVLRDAMVDRLRSRTSVDTFARAWNAGQRLSVAQAATAALLALGAVAGGGRRHVGRSA